METKAITILYVKDGDELVVEGFIPNIQIGSSLCFNTSWCKVINIHTEVNSWTLTLTQYIELEYVEQNESDGNKN